MFQIHELKILPEYFEEVLNENKRFEIRKDDRDFKVGDLIRLREFKDGEYTGRNVVCSISYILRNCKDYGLQEGYCILSIRLVLANTSISEAELTKLLNVTEIVERFKEKKFNNDIKLHCKYFDYKTKSCGRGYELDCDNCIHFRTF